MEYILIFWLAHGQPVATPMPSAFACMQGLNGLKGQDTSMKGICLPLGGDEGNYHNLFTEANPDIRN